MRGYFGLGQLSAAEKSDILDQHKSVYNGYQTMQPQVSNTQPLYVYDAEKIETQYNRLTNAFKVEKLRINYAMKALSNISILKLLQHLGSGLDTVSIQEVQLGLYAGFTPDKIIFTPNGVSFEEIEEVDLDKQNFIINLINTGKYTIPASYLQDTFDIEILDNESDTTPLDEKE